MADRTFGPQNVPTQDDQSDLLAKQREAEEKAAEKCRKEYETAREFDKFARVQYAVDRSYASGKALKAWASSANLIGSFIDILTSYLYAKNPDVSARAPRRVQGAPNTEEDAFAETMQIVLSRLWKRAGLKAKARKMIRSTLSTSVGWLKILMLTDHKENPQVANQMKDAQDNLKRLAAAREALQDGSSTEDVDLQIAQINQLTEGLASQLELVIYTGLSIDFCLSENIQCSLDVADTGDYLDADWMSDDIYVQKSDLKTRFPDLADADLKGASEYYQKTLVQEAQYDAMTAANGEGQFMKGGSSNRMGGSNPISFCKVTERWNHTTGLIETFIDGVKCWAKPPYPPPYASSRFYPYFRLAFYPVDGERHPQSLVDRLIKLQDEYSVTRSNGRLVRERSVPGWFFNQGQLSPEEVQKIQQSEHMEMIGLKPTSNDLPLEKAVTPKPIPRVDPALYDTTPIRRDMEVLSGVQEAQQGSGDQNKTATQAEIEQSGFNSRTGTDRDTLEDVLRDIAQYTAELALQCLTTEQVQKIAGPKAFWPFGMEIDDILNLVEVEIDAGSTGKPNSSAEKKAWSVILPQLTALMQQIRATQATDPGFAEALKNLLVETLKRLDDRLSVDRFIASTPAPLPLLPGAAVGAPPGIPSANGAEIPNPKTEPAALPAPTESFD